MTASRLEKLATDGVALSPIDVITSNSSVTATGLVSVFAHSNGTDLDMGAQTLCAGPYAKSSGMALTCTDHGLCHRHGIELDDPKLDRLLIDPQSFAGRINFLGTCFGLPLPERSTWAETLIAGLLAVNGVEAIIATWKTMLAPKHLLQALHFELAKGTPCGAAVWNYNKQYEVEKTGSFLCVVGDPNATVSGVEPIRMHDNLRPKRYQPTPGEGAFTHQFAQLIAAESIVDRSAIVAKHIERVGAQIFRDWCRCGTVLIRRSISICCCGEPRAETFVFRLSWGKVPRFRKVVFCPICGFIGDRDVLDNGQHLVGVSDGVLTISCDTDFIGYCGVRLESQAAKPVLAETIFANGGANRICMSVPEGRGPLYAAAFFVSERNIALESRRIR